METIRGVETQEQLEAILQRLAALVPTSQNPYSTLLSQLANPVNPKQPRSAVPLLIAASVGAAVAFLAYIVVFVIRWRKGILWIVRLTRARSEPYIVWQFQNAWALAASFMLLTFQGYVWSLYRLNRGALVPDLLYWVTLCWMPGVVALVIACWTITTTYILHRRTYSGSRTVFPFYYSSRLISATFVSLVVGFVTLLLYYSLASGAQYRSMTNSYTLAAATLTEAEAAWSGTLDPSVLSSVASPLFELIQDAQALVWSFRRAFIVSGTIALGMEVYYLVLALLYIKALRQSLREVQDKSPIGVAVFSKTLHGVVTISFGFLAWTTSIAANGIWVAVLSERVLTSGLYAALSAIIPTLTTVAGALLIAGIMLFQTLTSPPVYFTASSPSRFRSGHPASPRPLAKPGRDLSLHLTAFALAASEPLPSLAYLTYSDEGHGGHHHHAASLPFENLELQPTRESLADSLASTVHAERGRDRPGGGVGDGIVVNKEQIVTVVELREKQWSSALDEGEEEKLW
ncbi:hypothetical protein JCM10213_000996 [Rhodosporidiobolus nylandii]